MSNEQIITYTAEEQRELSAIENTSRILKNASVLLSQKTQVNAQDAQALLEACQLINTFYQNTLQGAANVQQAAKVRLAKEAKDALEPKESAPKLKEVKKAKPEAKVN